MGLIELDDQAALAEVVSGSDVRGVLAGHLHYSTFSTFAGVPVSVSAASCYNIDLVADSSKILSAKANSLSASLVSRVSRPGRVLPSAHGRRARTHLL
jgi:3',5'-cyclic AMP phosphodiesterase CpdA